MLTSGSFHVTEVLEGVPHVAVHLVEVVHEAPPVHRAGEVGEVPAGSGIETGESCRGVGGVLQARNVPVRKVATKQDVRDTASLQLCREVEVGQEEEVLVLLTGQTGLVPLPGLSSNHRGGRDEVAHRGEVRTELSGETGQSSQVRVSQGRLHLIQLGTNLD